MHHKYQRGAVSLLWCAVFVGIVTLAAMVVLMSARHERNYFAEAWKRVSGGAPAQMLKTVKQDSVHAVKGEASAVRKCIVDGKVVYSNVDCLSDNPSSRTVQLHDTRGIEAPKMPAPDTHKTPETLQQRMIEQAAQ